MKSNPILEKKLNYEQHISTTHNADYVYINNKELHADMLSDFYDYLDKYYDLVGMQPGKEFLIKSFIEK